MRIRQSNPNMDLFNGNGVTVGVSMWYQKNEKPLLLQPRAVSTRPRKFTKEESTAGEQLEQGAVIVVAGIARTVWGTVYVARSLFSWSDHLVKHVLRYDLHSHTLRILDRATELPNGDPLERSNSYAHVILVKTARYLASLFGL